MLGLGANTTQARSTPTPAPAPALLTAVGRPRAGAPPSPREAALRAVEADLHVTALAQTPEHYKYETSTHPPTRFTEAQLDFFSHHKFAARRDPVDAAQGLAQGRPPPLRAVPGPGETHGR